MHSSLLRDYLSMSAYMSFSARDHTMALHACVPHDFFSKHGVGLLEIKKNGLHLYMYLTFLIRMSSSLYLPISLDIPLFAYLLLTLSFFLMPLPLLLTDSPTSPTH